MGYVNDTHMSQFLAPSDIIKTSGTWTAALASNVVSESRSAAAASFLLLVPIKLPGNGAPLKGASLKSIDVYYSVVTADAADFATVALNKVTLPESSGSAPSGSACTVTIDTNHDTAAKRKAVGDHHMTITLDSPAWIDEDEAYVLSCTIDGAAATVFKLYGARANYTLRV